MDERTLLARALDAQGPLPTAPDDFAERVLAAMPAPRRRAVLAPALGLAALAAGAVLAFGLPWSREGSVRVGDAAQTVALGGRAVAGAEPGTALRYRVGGWGRGDRVELAEGEAFFRVDHGRGFEVVTPHGTVTVTGTCFRVVARGRGAGKQEGLAMRSGWFAGGVATALLAVQVYEGGVRVARAGDPGGAVTLRAGQLGGVTEDGRVRAELPAAQAVPTAAAVSATAPSAPTAEDLAARAEVVRLRTILARHGIAAESGAVDGGATRASGLVDPGNTNLTAEEWRTLAERGEIRFRLPASNRREGLDDAHARALGVPDDTRAEVNEVFRQSQAELQRALGALYREAAAAEPGSMSVEALMNELRDKAADGVVNDTVWRLAQERGGLSPAREPSAEQTPYERALRAMLGYERDLERRLAALLGERLAHDMLVGDRAVPAHSFGMAARHAP